jgi:hypothetical protein
MVFGEKYRRSMKFISTMVWLRILITAAISIAMGGNLSNGEEREWKLELPSFSGVMEQVLGGWELGSNWTNGFSDKGMGRPPPQYCSSAGMNGLITD